MKVKSVKSETLLDNVHLKKTAARVALLDLLSTTKMPLPAKAIALKLESKGVDKVTVYRMLEAVTEKGLVRRVETGSREAQYEIIDTHDDHHHVICLECKKVADFTGCDSDVLISKALKQVKNFKSISHHSFDLFGLCNACAKK
jgi:Fe2+ or Zn2+ uptake regulation protein